ncbi:tripartite motif-containing protein 59-like [Mya arenaria]|uniref:tripartite motif-containing protein 59-like n=1 Tax=Mya arenaria TaxID=6604 RepID=UPI0022E23E0E|nr:tripartite motif-containing protein 59-like [Mya arenaria]
MGSGITKPRRKPELLQCSICFNVYKVPRMLPCQHTFCETCLHTYITKSDNLTEASKEFPCPLCRESIPIPQADKPKERWAKLFPKNRLMMSLFEGEYQHSDRCRLHPTKMVEFFCENHVEIGCATCLITRHKGCEVTQLDTYIKSGKFKRTCNKDNDMLQQYLKLYEDMIVEANKNLDSIDNEKQTLIEDVKKVRTTIEEMLKSMEQTLIQTIEERCKAESDSISELTARCKKVITDIGTSVEQIKAAQLDIRQVQKAEIVVTVEEKLNTYGNTLREELDNFKCVNFLVTYNSLIDEVQNKLKGIGELNMQKSDINFPLPPFVPGANSKKPEIKRRKNKHVVRISEHSVNGENESFFCNITSTVVLPDGRIILSDDSNSKLKMMTSKFEFDFELALDSNPLNLAVVSDSQIAVSVPGKREILFVDVGDKEFSIARRLHTRLDCWGVEVLDNVVVITTGRDGHSVIVYDIKGEELNSYLLTAHADENIRCPVSVIADKKKRNLYITCTGGAWSKGCVVCMDLQGTLLNVYHDPDIDTPRSCALDRHGKLYICGLESSTVYQISPSGDMYKIFPSRSEQVIGPLHMSFLQNYHIRFLLTEVASDTLKMYELPTAK